jgi:hypothetical protein
VKKRQQGDDGNKKEEMVMTTLKRRATNDSTKHTRSETTRISANGNPTLCTSVIVPGRGYHVQSLSQVVQIHTTLE